ncbi:hypothetical protein [Mycobacteroides abscessus]|uniref:hypothetical protein n=1 Tax=Mycobacteroides abscessus TaxID=36809 RepID=UPI000926F155|nr:hypothetical protein [Mycobacteroides abscessus]SHQ66976.1 Uncharacterised protein [Mycobacteroides abscessus subsp. abscessus]SHR24196.1 Uncharacterised protein [Mycobacteroides abscessus subsp. abscessus]SHS16746.1 Uncharacterised protein [Mycobacteroides abscessus subsp. abscessus]SHT43640.1 Uncharacterised protein [Mycobacteroides abscessus subsp. abscessus]SHT58183.1 Uncharacterised protein [Mycobacteroides abscessus subsp. abscessus]
MTLEYPAGQFFQNQTTFHANLQKEKPSRAEWCAAWLVVVLATFSLSLAAATPQVSTEEEPNAAAAGSEPSSAYSANEAAAAKKKACAAWGSASDSMNAAANAVADTPKGWDNPVRQKARDTETWVSLSQTAYLRSQIEPATPADLSAMFKEYNALTFAQQDAEIHHAGKTLDLLLDQQNAVMSKVDALCGS